MARALAEQVAPGESAGTATAASERTARLPETSSVFVQVSTRVHSPSAAQHNHKYYRMHVIILSLSFRLRILSFTTIRSELLSECAVF